MVRPGAPSAGDLVWLNFKPPVGHEQTGRRPVLVVSPLRYNRLVGRAPCSPVTSKRTGYAFGVPIPPGCGVDGVVLADQLRSLDWAHRNPEPAGRVPEARLREVQARVTALLGYYPPVLRFPEARSVSYTRAAHAYRGMGSTTLLPASRAPVGERRRTRPHKQEIPSQATEE